MSNDILAHLFFSVIDRKADLGRQLPGVDAAGEVRTRVLCPNRKKFAALWQMFEMEYFYILRGQSVRTAPGKQRGRTYGRKKKYQPRTRGTGNL